MSGGAIEFTEMRPRVRLLLELYANAANEEARATLMALFEDVFLAAAWNIATDLLDNGWEPTVARPGHRPAARLRVV